VCVRERERKKEKKDLTEGGFTGQTVRRFVFLHRFFS